MKYFYGLFVSLFIFSVSASGDENKDISDESFKENGRVKFFRPLIQ
jgi:hypothetical protein